MSASGYPRKRRDLRSVEELRRPQPHDGDPAFEELQGVASFLALPEVSMDPSSPQLSSSSSVCEDSSAKRARFDVVVCAPAPSPSPDSVAGESPSVVSSSSSSSSSSASASASASASLQPVPHLSMLVEPSPELTEAVVNLAAELALAVDLSVANTSPPVTAVRMPAVWDTSNWNPLHWACWLGLAGAARFLIRNTGGTMLRTDVAGPTLLHLASLPGHAHVVRLLLEESAEGAENASSGLMRSAVNWVDAMGRTALIMASCGDHLPVVRLLADHGADLETQDASMCTALHYAASKGNVEMAKFLANRGANLNVGALAKQTAVYMAADAGHVAVVRCLAHRGANLELCNDHGSTPLNVAAWNGHSVTVKELANYGASLTAPNDHGFTPLHSACENGHVTIIKFLLRRGVPPSSVDRDGMVPLARAADRGRAQAVELLLDRVGVDDVIGRSPSVSPLLLAQQRGHTAIAARIRAWICRYEENLSVVLQDAMRSSLPELVCEVLDCLGTSLHK